MPVGHHPLRGARVPAHGRGRPLLWPWHHPRYHTPVVCLLVQGGWSAVQACSGTYAQLYTYVVFAVFVFHASRAGPLRPAPHAAMRPAPTACGATRGCRPCSWPRRWAWWRTRCGEAGGVAGRPGVGGERRAVYWWWRRRRGA
jgi:hypothetical protein